MAQVTRLSLDENGGLERRRVQLHDIAEDVDAPRETLGQDLRAARQRKGDDIATVSKALKIRKDHLQAIEENNLDFLPGRTYAIGFVRSYAEYLGLDPAHCVERLKNESIGRESTETDSVNLSPDIERKLPQGWIVFVVLIVIGVIYGGYYISQSAKRMLASSVTPVPESLVTEAPVAEQPPPPSINVPAPVPQSTEPPPAQTPDAAALAAAPAVQGPATPAPARPDQQASLPNTTATVPPAASATSAAAEQLPEGRALGLQNRNARVELRIHKPVRVLVQGPNNMVFINRALRPGDSYRAPNKTGLNLSASDAGAVEVILDGVSVGYAGRDGSLAEALSLDPQAIVDRNNAASR
jgi:cytoskeleton protein RodZ